MAIEGVRARARAEITAEITAEARRQLAEVGPAALSLRAVARSVGMVSSGIYRYFASRDELLTALIVEAYDALGKAAEIASRRHRSKPPLTRWVATCRVIRRWALDHPHEYALVYGSPVPGYHAPQDTIGPAERVPGALLGIADDAASNGRLRRPDGRSVSLTPKLRSELRAIALQLSARNLRPDDVVRLVAAWSQLFGLITFELFGQTENAVTAHDELFDTTAITMGRLVGLTDR